MSDGRSHRYFTFECGVTVELKRVPPLTIQEFGRQYEMTHPVPPPPAQPVNYGNGEVLEENTANPAYKQALAVYEGEKARSLMDFILLKGIKVEVDATAMAEARADTEAFGVKLEGDERLLYIKHVLIGTTEELQALREAIMLRAQPTEAAIKEAEDRFKSPVQGPPA